METPTLLEDFSKYQTAETAIVQKIVAGEFGEEEAFDAAASGVLAMAISQAGTADPDVLMGAFRGSVEVSIRTMALAGVDFNDMEDLCSEVIAATRMRMRVVARKTTLRAVPHVDSVDKVDKVDGVDPLDDGPDTVGVSLEDWKASGGTVSPDGHREL